jgi:exonuclease III
VISIVSWNMNGLDLWGRLVADDSFNLALVQEARSPVDGTVAEVVPSVAEPWTTSGWKSRSWRTAVAALSPDLKLRPRKMMAGHEVSAGAFEVSRPGTLTVADVMRDEADVLTVASMYGAWESPPGANRPIYADASAHRLLSDLAQLVTTRRGHRLVLAGDLNVLYGYGEHGDPYWAGRYQTVFDRAAAMGLVFVGPQAPNGRQATPWPEELPVDSLNVPTFHHSQQTPATATRQLDFVFASQALADQVHVAALNEVDDWGPSDHCRVSILVAV